MTERTPGQPGTGQGGHPSVMPADPDSPARPTDDAGTRLWARVRGSKILGPATWLVLLASFGLSAATWIALAELAGYTEHLSVTGPLGTATVRLAWLMPVAVDGYVVVALVAWTSAQSAKIAGFARWNTYTAAGTSVAAQSAYHALTAWSTTGALWRALIAAVVGAAVPAFAALAIHMKALVWREPNRTPEAPAKRTAAQRTSKTAGAPTRTPEPADTPGTVDTPKKPDTSNVTALSARNPRTGQSGPTVDELADTLGAAFQDRIVGQPLAIAELRRVHGSCSKERAIAAKNEHNRRVSDRDPADDSERVLVGVGA